jgi:TM2 domain-containing membrane protein YozV
MDPKRWDGWDIFRASSSGRIDIVRLLIEEHGEDPISVFQHTLIWHMISLCSFTRARRCVLSTDPVEGLMVTLREQISNGQFEDASRSARAVLALEEGNEEASNLLTAATAALSGTESEPNTELEELKEAAAEVQKAINGRRTRDAETLISIFLNKYPDNENAKQIRLQVREANSKNMDYIRRQNARKAGITESQPQVSSRSWLPLFLFCLVLGSLGVHRFYAGKHTSGIIMFLTLGLFGLWTLVDFIIILFNGFTDSDNLPIKR